MKKIGEEHDKPTKKEVEEIVHGSRNGKAPGTEAIELIEYGGEELRKKVYNPIMDICYEEKILKE